MTPRLREICGCEKCIIPKALHKVLLKFRTNHLKHLQTLVEQSRTRNQQQIQQRLTMYQNQAFPNDEPLHATLKQAAAVICCPAPNDKNIIKMHCALRFCDNCPQYNIPDEEQAQGPNAPVIHFTIYTKQSRCAVHGFVPGNPPQCPECMENVAQDTAPTKLPSYGSKQYLTKKTCSIGQFHSDYYQPFLEKYVYHRMLFSCLGQYEAKKSRKDAFKANIQSVMTERDYAEGMKCEFDQEIQSEAFGYNRTLSIEGSSCEYHVQDPDNDTGNTETCIKMDFHSHFSDSSKQNAATTYEHMKTSITHMIENHQLAPGYTIYDTTDGCSKQYRCANAMYLLSKLSMMYQIYIDRCVCAPGHGRSKIDGINGADKSYLKTKMAMIGSHEHNNMDRRMDSASIIQDQRNNVTEFSFAKECVRICSMSYRAHGVEGDNKHKKRYETKKLANRYYHYQDKNDLEFETINKTFRGFKTGRKITKHGCSFHYNYRCDPALGLGYIATRRIPCCCQACLNQLALPWDVTKSKYDQPRYQGDNQDCINWPIFGRYNNWRIVFVTNKSAHDNNSYEDDLNESKQIAVDTIVNHVAKSIQIDNYGAVSTNDTATDHGYYLVQWTSLPYELDTAQQIDSITLQPGEKVCDAVYLNPLANIQQWYTPYDQNADGTTLIRISTVLHGNVHIETLAQHPLPSHITAAIKTQAEQLQAIRITDMSHDKILQEIFNKEQIDFVQDVINDDNSDSENDE